MKILAVIPARGGSKSIPRKNIRLLNGKPLINYIINTATACSVINDIVVTTDDDEIKDYVESYDNIKILDRDPAYATDDATLDIVVYDALIRSEKERKTVYDIVITLQPTSPLLKPATLTEAIEAFMSSEFDTMISVRNDPHLAWGGDKTNALPLYEKRLNRQYLPNYFLETGAFLISKRECVTESTRIGESVCVFEVNSDEAVDIDDNLDWVQCETLLRRKRIVFRTDAYIEIGMGHVYNCLTLAYNMLNHELMFVCNEAHNIGIEKISASKFPLTTVRSDENFYRFLSQYKPDIVIIDQLNTEEDYIKKIKSLVPRVITIEDLGSGIYHADAVINAIYEDEHHLSHVYSGKDYFCLRDEFLIATPKEFSPVVKDVFIMFGGTDPSNFTKKVYDMVLTYCNGSNITFTFAAGMSYDYEVNGIRASEHLKILLFNDVKRISRYMRRADIAIISQGRSAYEIASLGIPAIILSHHARELTHTFGQMENGFLNLGMGGEVSEDALYKTFSWLVQTPHIRAEMRRLQLQNDFKHGIERVKKIILGD